jgi:hypothetical protein
MITVGLVLAAAGFFMIFVPVLQPFGVVTVLAGLAFALVARSERSRSARSEGVNPPDGDEQHRDPSTS